MNSLDRAIDEYYKTKIPIDTICKTFGVGKATFYRHLPKENRRGYYNQNRQYNFNIQKLIKDSSDKFYWLGFLAADGSVVNNTLIIHLNIIDKKHLELFKVFIEANYNVEEILNSQNRETSKIQINSFELISYLRKYNIIQNKSLIFSIPVKEIPEKYLFDFLRGLIDGDGCIRINNHQQISLSFCSGSKKCVEQMNEFLGINNKISKYENTYSIQVTGNKKAKAILDKLYSTSTENTRLSRKYQIYRSLTK